MPRKVWVPHLWDVVDNKKKRPSLNIPTDSIPVKLFTYFILLFLKFNVVFHAFVSYYIVS